MKTADIRKAANFYGSKLLSKQLLKNIELTIIVKPIEDKGYCDWMDRPVRPREFKIFLNSSFKTKTTLLILAHEFTHLKQMAMGELTDETTRRGVQWKKQDVNTEKTDYFDLPYEIEAFGREYGLYVRMIENMAVGRQGVAKSS